MNEYDLPDREHGWTEIDAPFFDGPAFKPDIGRVETNRDSYSYLDANQIAMLPEGAGDLLSGDVEIVQVPEYYSRFDEFGGHFQQVDTSGNHVGWGLTPYHLEDIVRVVTGGGRYRSGDLTVTSVGDRLYVVEYGDYTWVASASSIGAIPDGYDIPTTEVAGMEVPDDRPGVLKGVERLVEFADEYFKEIVAFDKVTDNPTWYFIQADGTPVHISGHSLYKLGTNPRDSDEIQREYTIETEYDEEYSVSWDEVEYGIGDEIRENARCVGYQMQWKDPRTSSRASMTGKIMCRATYFYLLFRENYHDTGNDTYDVRDTQRTLAKFEPENEDWSPL